MLKRALILALALLGAAAAYYAGKTHAQGTTPAVASPERAARIDHAREVLQAYVDSQGIKDTAIVTDTGQDVELEPGALSPVITIKLPKTGHACVLAMHPTEDLFATFVCEDVPPETGV